MLTDNSREPHIIVDIIWLPYYTHLDAALHNLNIILLILNQEWDGAGPY